MSEREVADFQRVILGYYEEYGRFDLPWRQPEADGSFDPYKILVSELMLQQTQVMRVIPKYEQFLQRFPTFNALAAAPLGDILRVWSGLGYNRRAKFLHQTAKQVIEDFDGHLPQSEAQLVKLPGIGKNTAGAILAYAYNKPVIFIETNIRTVYIHHFFADHTDIPDSSITKIVTSTIWSSDPRTWYWALMDYGTHLKQTVGNLNKSSKSYVKQSKFAGSRRQVRGQILALLGGKAQTQAALAKIIPDERLPSVLDDLLEEALVKKYGQTYSL